MMRKVIENKKKQAPFQMFFLRNDENQSVESIEVNEIDFEEVKKHLEKGESVLLSKKEKRKPDVNFIAYEQVKEPWYILRR